MEKGVEERRKGRRVEEGEYGRRGGRGLETGARVQGEEALYRKGWGKEVGWVERKVR